MSQWTHVAAILRIDSLRAAGLPDPLGENHRAVLGHPTPAHTDDCYDDPVWGAENDKAKGFSDLPTGSEGSLQYQIWENPMKAAAAAYTVSIWGDLRDYSNVDEILVYIERITKEVMMIRQGVLEIEVEGNLPRVWQHTDNNAWVELTAQ